MEVLSTPDAIYNRFAALTKQSDRIQIAAAWATPGRAIACLQETRGPRVEAIVGLSGDLTSPDALEQLNDRCVLKVAEHPRNAIFHPKLYLFEGQGGSL